MATSEAEASGFISKVRKSLVSEDRLAMVPYMSALANGVLWVIVSVSFQRYRCLLIGVIFHLSLAVLTRHDIHRLANLGWYMTYRAFYGRSEDESTPPFGDLLPWDALVDVDGGTLRTKDDGLLCTYALVPYDLGCLSEDEQGSLMHRINMLKRLDEQWAVWAHWKRIPYTADGAAMWPCEEAAVLDDEHRAHLDAPPGLWTTQIYLTLWHRAPSTTRRWLRSLFFTEDTRTYAEVSPFQAAFEADVDRMMATLATACRSVRRLTGQELCRYLHGMVSIYDHPVEVPDVPVDLAYKLSEDSDFWHGTRPWIGKSGPDGTDPHSLRVLGLSDDIPNELWAGMLRNLYRLPMAFDWVTRWIPMQREKADSFTTKKQINWRSKKIGWLAGFHERITGQKTEVTNTYMTKQGEDAAAAQEEMLSDESRLGSLSITFFLHRADPAEADRDIRAVQKAIQMQGCICVDEDLGATEGYRGSIAGNVLSNVRRHHLKTMNVCHLGPFHAPSAGTPRNSRFHGPPLLRAITEECMPFDFDPFVDDLGDTMTVGPKGAGKSTLSAFMDFVQWLKYPESQVIAWDVGGSWRCVTLFLHGAYYDLAHGDAQIQILHGIHDDRQVPWISDWLVERVREKNVLITPEEERIISGAIRRLRENRSIPRRMGSLLSMFDEHLRHVELSSNSKIDANGMSRRDSRLDDLVLRIRQVRSALALWAEGGKYGHLVDAKEDRMAWHRVSTFELRDLLDLPGAYGGVHDVLIHRMDQRIDGRPTRLPFGEAWECFSNERRIEGLRTRSTAWRRDNASPNYSTQSISQMKGNILTALIFESCQSRLWLPNPEALNDEVIETYTGMELYKEEIRDNIVLATPKHNAYVVRPDLRRLINVRFGPMAQLVCGSNSKEAHAEMDELLDQYGAEEFSYQLLRRHGFHDAAQRLLPSAAMVADD